MKQFIPFRCQSGLMGEVNPLRASYKDLNEFIAYCEMYGLHKRLRFETPEDAWDENPWVEHSTNPEDFRIAEFPDAYLHVRECRSGQEWIRPIDARQVLDLKRRVKDWIKAEFSGELKLDGEIMPKLEGDYYASIITDNRPPDSVVVWVGGGFYLK